MSIARKGFDRLARGAALALVATSLLLLQPICAAAEQHDFSADSCCASLEVAQIAAAASASSGPDERFAVVPHPVQTPQRQAAPDSFALPVAVSSLPPLRYYARSARILR